MRPEYDIFEKLPDGSSIWRVCVPGQYDAERKLQELAVDAGGAALAGVRFVYVRLAWIEIRPIAMLTIAARLFVHNSPSHGSK